MKLFAVFGCHLLLAYLTTVDSAAVIGKTCQPAQTLCLGVAIDASGSIGQTDFQKNLIVVRKIAEAVPKGSYLAVTTYGTHNKSVCRTTSDIAGCLKDVDKAPYQKSSTRTDRGIDAIVTELKSCPKNSLRVLIVFTDGKSTSPDLTKVSAGNAKAEGIVTQVVGVGPDVNDPELQAIASSSKDVYKVKNYQALVDSVTIFIQAVCNAAPPVTPCQPSKTLCLGVAIDASGSIGQTNFQKNLNVVRKIAEAVPKESYLAVTTYGTHNKSVCHTTNDIQGCLKAVDKAPYQSSTTHTDLGIDAIVFELKSCPKNSLQVLIVFTDGKSTYPDLTKVSAVKAKAEGIVTQVVGVGSDVNDPELQAIASSSKDVYKVKDYQALVDTVTTFIQAVCNAQPPVIPCQPTQTVCLGVAIDASGSIGQANFQKNLNVIRKIAEAVPKGSYLAVSTYGTHNRSVCHTTNDVQGCLKTVDSAAYQNSTTHTDLGIDAIVYELKSCPKNTLKVLIVFTDGKSTYPDKTRVSAVKAQEESIVCQAVGVGSQVYDPELQAIASSSNDVYKVTDYQALVESVGTLIKAVCNATPKPPTVKQCPPAKKLCTFFAMDGSASEDSTNFQKIKEAVIYIIRALSDGSYCASAAYGTHTYIAATLTANKTECEKKTSDAAFRNSSTHTDVAIDTGVQTLASAPKDCQKLIVVLTDGQSTYPDRTAVSADKAHQANIAVAVVAIGNKVNTTELNVMASSKDLVLTANDVIDLLAKITDIAQVVCNATPEPTTTTTTTTTTTPKPTTTTPKPTTTTPEPTTTTTTTATTTPKTTVKPCPPADPICASFVCDSSSSILQENYNKILKVICEIAQAFPAGSRASLDIYGTHSYSISSLEQDMGLFCQKVLNSAYRNSTTRTDLGIDAGKLQLDSAPEGCKKLMLVLTDGQSTKPDLTLISAGKVHDAGITTFSIGIGPDVNFSELNSIATSKANVYQPNNYEELIASANSIAQASCDAMKS